jgi:hypothetical protein
MRIQLWYSKELKLWRWSLSDYTGSSPMQETGSQPDLRVAMGDIANTVEYLIEQKNGKSKS